MSIVSIVYFRTALNHFINVTVRYLIIIFNGFVCCFLRFLRSVTSFLHSNFLIAYSSNVT